MRRALAALAVAVLAAACEGSEPRVYTDQTRNVPDVAGSTVDEARSQLEAEGYEVDVLPTGGTPVPASSCPGAEVHSTDPPAGTEVQRASPVRLLIEAC